LAGSARVGEAALAGEAVIRPSQDAESRL